MMAPHVTPDTGDARDQGAGPAPEEPGTMAKHALL
jgi:hypothetical protein